MSRLTAIRRTRRALGRALLIGAVCMLGPALARAHFILVTPDSWMSQDSLGLPEKLRPCGDEGGGTPTGKVSFAIASADPPASARMIIAPSGGQCGDANFPSCEFNMSGSKLRCK